MSINICALWWIYERIKPGSWIVFIPIFRKLHVESIGRDRYLNSWWCQKENIHTQTQGTQLLGNVKKVTSKDQELCFTTFLSLMMSTTVVYTKETNNWFDCFSGMQKLNDSIKKEPHQRLRQRRWVVNKYVLEMTYSNRWENTYLVHKISAGDSCLCLTCHF